MIRYSKAPTVMVKAVFCKNGFIAAKVAVDQNRNWKEMCQTGKLDDKAGLTVKKHY